MAAVAFDTLLLARKLRDSAEMSQAQAEGVACALAEALSGAELATKGDLNQVKSELQREIAGTKSELQHDIRELELKVSAQFKGVNAQFGVIDARFCVIDERFDKVLERIDRRAAESDVRMFRYVLGTSVTATLTVLGAIWTAARFMPGLLHP